MLDLNVNEAWFGATGGGEMITLKDQEGIHPRFLKSFFFVLHDDRFEPAGKAFCKVNGLLMDNPVIGHQGGMEARMLLLFEKQSKSDPGLRTLNLPTAYWASEHVPVTCKALGELPMIAWGRRVYPHCAVTVCEWYSGSFTSQIICDFMLSGEMRLRVFLFELIHTLAELQRRYKFQHNDLHKDNVLVKRLMDEDELFPEMIVQVKKRIGRRKEVIKFKIPERSEKPILWDFGMSVFHAAKDKVSIPDVCGPHPDVGPHWCVPKTYEAGYDIHGLFMNILSCLPPDSEASQFIHDLYPEELIPKIEYEEEDLSEASTSSTDMEDLLPTKGLNDQEKKFRDLLVHLSSHELITMLPDLKAALQDVLGAGQSITTDEKVYEEEMNNIYGDISNSTNYKDLCYGADASFMDYWFYLYPEEDRRKCIEVAEEHAFNFAPPNESELIAAYKLCKKAWETYSLPTPYDILLHPYFDVLRIKTDDDDTLNDIDEP